MIMIPTFNCKEKKVNGVIDYYISVVVAMVFFMLNECITEMSSILEKLSQPLLIRVKFDHSLWKHHYYRQVVSFEKNVDNASN